MVSSVQAESFLGSDQQQQQLTLTPFLMDVFLFIHDNLFFLTNAVMILFPICTICDITAPNHSRVVGHFLRCEEEGREEQ